MEIQFVYFDAGFTLIRPYPSVGFHYAAVAESYGVRIAPEKLNVAFGTAWKETRRRYEPLTPVPYGRTEAESIAFWSDVVRATFSGAGGAAPELKAFFDEVFSIFATGSCWKEYDDTKAALDFLDRKGIRYGVLSNWDARLRPVLRDLKLDSRMQSLVLSYDVGVEKPSRGIFDAAAQMAGCPPESIALIGDEPKSDGWGPRDAGWKQCLIVRGNTPPPDGLNWAPTLVEAVQSLVKTA